MAFYELPRRCERESYLTWVNPGIYLKYAVVWRISSIKYYTSTKKWVPCTHRANDLLQHLEFLPTISTVTSRPINRHGSERSRAIWIIILPSFRVHYSPFEWDLQSVLFTSLYGEALSQWSSLSLQVLNTVSSLLSGVLCFLMKSIFPDFAVHWRNSEPERVFEKYLLFNLRQLFLKSYPSL